MRNRFGWLGRGTTPNIPPTFLTQFLWDTKIPPSTTAEFFDSLFAIVNLLFHSFSYCHCNIHLIFSSTIFYSNINYNFQSKQLELAYTQINTYHRQVVYIHTHTHIKQKQHQKGMLKFAELDLCC